MLKPTEATVKIPRQTTKAIVNITFHVSQEVPAFGQLVGIWRGAAFMVRALRIKLEHLVLRKEHLSMLLKGAVSHPTAGCPKAPMVPSIARSKA